METTALEEAYAGLIAAALAAPTRHPAEPPGEHGTDWTLAHIALSDRLLASTAREVLVGVPPLLDNGPAMDPAAIKELTSSAGRHVLVELVRRNGAELVGLIGRIPVENRSVPVAVRLVGDTGEELFAGPVPWGEIVRMRAEEHIPGHTARLWRAS